MVLSLSFAVLPAAAMESPGPARIAADLSPGTQPEYQQSDGMLRVGNRLVYLRRDGEQAPFLWVTDGTRQGTGPVGVVCPPCAFAEPMGSTGSVAFYRVTGNGYPDLETRIWRTDGTPAGTFPVTEGLLAPRYRFLSGIAGGRVFFTGCTPELGCEPWSSDGTQAGTGPVGETMAGPEGPDFFEISEAGGQVFFVTGDSEDPDENRILWRADASGHGLRRLRATPRARSFVTAGNRLFFVAQAAGQEVWTSDGSREGTRPLTSFTPTEPFGYRHFIQSVAGRVYFLADDGAHGFELWSLGANGTAPRRLTNFSDPSAGVLDVAKIGDRILFVAVQDYKGQLWTSRGDLRSSAPLKGGPDVTSPLGAAGSRFVFYGRDGGGYGFWSTDGTGAGTRLLRRPDHQRDLVQVAAAGGRVLFAVAEEYEGTDLWISDGSAAGTFSVGYGGPHWSHYYGWSGLLTAETASGRLVFDSTGPDADSVQASLWSSDGTLAGTHPLSRARVGKGSYPQGLVPFRDGVLVESCTGTDIELRFVHGPGTGAESARLLAWPSESCGGGSSYVDDLIDLGDVAVLITYTEGGYTLWRTDGTAAGTVALLPESEAGLFAMVRFGQKIAIWRAESPTDHPFVYQIWVTDGTAQGTHLLVDLPPDLDLNGLTAVGDKLYFVDSEPLGEGFVHRPWVSDGTAAGTRPLTSIAEPRVPSITKSLFTGLDGRAYFWLIDGDGPIELWSSDGTPGGTAAVTTGSGILEPEGLQAVGGRLYFAARREGDPSSRLLPWVSDGTDGGTVPLENPAIAGMDLLPPSDSYVPDTIQFVELAGRVFFTAFDPAHGDELWATDGTPEGTRLVQDTVPGPASFYPRELAAWQGRVWFSGLDVPHGQELWSSDGTPQGTRFVQNIALGPSWSDPSELTPAGPNLYFSAFERVHGRELWVLPDIALDTAP